MPFLRLISRLPLPAWYALAGLLGLLVFRVAGYRSGVARDNLALWHGVGSAMYLLQWLCATSVFWRLLKK